MCACRVWNCWGIFGKINMQFQAKAPLNPSLTKEEIVSLLQDRGCEQQQLFERARAERLKFFREDSIEVRSVLEISNICTQNCRYCNMANNRSLTRYTLDSDQITEILSTIYARGRRFFLLQSGENRSKKFLEDVARALRKIKESYSDVTLILCLGALTQDEYRMLRESGGDRYILKFETSSPTLFEIMKPGTTLEKRLTSLQWAIEAGFQVGTGNIVGLPGQTLESIADDLLLTTQFDLSMASASVFIPGEGSAFANHPPGCVDTTLNAMAILRILHPSIRIPSTSSLEKLRPGGQLMGLRAGANTVTIHDATPEDYKKLFPIYSLHRFIPDEKHCIQILEHAKSSENPDVTEVP